MLPHSELIVGSALIYPSRGVSPASQEAKSFIRYGIKQAAEDKDERAVRRVLEYLKQQSGPVEELLRDAGILVPAPRRTPRLKDSLWPAERIALEMYKGGIGQQISPLLNRQKAVPPSSGIRDSAQRPDPDLHYASLEIILQGEIYRSREIQKITIVDDVVTRGSTLIGCAARLRNAFPHTDVQAFALARTETEVDLATTQEMLDPLRERISYDPKFHNILRRRPA